MFDVLLEREAKDQLEIEERSPYSACSRANYHNDVLSSVFSEDLNYDAWLNYAEFKDKYHMTPSSFWLIVDQIKDHGVFQRKKKQQARVEYQLMTLLCFLSMEKGIA
jgi:hypothetical protein